MLKVSAVTIDDGDLIRKIDKALQKLGQDIAARPDITTKRVANIKISLTPAESFVTIEYSVAGLEPPDAPIKTIAFMNGTQLVKQLPLFDNLREAPPAAAPRSDINKKEVKENHV